ncbi:MAG: metal-dependent hydrolase [Melioribacteraceae bacterium]|nr:metal-dependent hydrolase [Melioribacteraceae bacterium]MCF8353625.1 metal-dependent hydrolase [Melioribacteraceae bacterium]MCF8393395.1 metal-dependent hydrolase [Melioribacteraceae bacterium]
MFVGHYGVGFAAKKIDNKPSLGTIFFAAQFIDLLWPVLLLLGIEHVQIDPGNTAFTPLNFSYYPFSHSLLGVLVWGALFGFAYYLIKKEWKTSLLLGVLVLSHWVLDLFTHRPDLPLVPWSEIKVGFGLWNSVIFTIIVELGIFFAGVYFYLTSTKAINKKGSVGLWSLVVFLTIIYFMNVFGPPPESEGPLAYVGLSQWLIVAWGYFIDPKKFIGNKFFTVGRS